MDNIKNIPKGSDSGNIEKIHKKSAVFAQTFKNVTQGDTAKNTQTTGIADPLTIEKRQNTENRWVPFLDIYI